MKISELGMGENVDLEEAVVVSVDEPKTFVKFGRPLKLATATLKDDSGEIKMTLWNKDVDEVKAGDKVKLTSCFVKEFQGEKQLTTGKLGKIEVLKN